MLVDIQCLSGCRHPTEPSCSYDPVDGLPLAPDSGPLEKIKALEDQLSTSQCDILLPGTNLSAGALRNQLRESNASSPSASVTTLHPSSSLTLTTPELSPEIIVLPNAPDQLQGTSPISSLHSTTSSPDAHMLSSKLSPSPGRELLISGWNQDLPEPSLLNHL